MTNKYCALDTISETFEKANAGDTAAEYNIGSCYYSGEGTSLDYAKAESWYRKAAAKDYSMAQYMLGVYAFYGLSSSKNYKEAVRQFKLAVGSDTTNSDAQYMLGECYLKGLGIKKRHRLQTNTF